MPKVDGPSPQRNWYKVATLALSAAMVGIMFVSGIYYKRIDNRTRRIDAVQDKIQKFLEQRSKVVEFPKVEVSLLTLEKSGLPRSAFSGLAEIPAVIRICHAGGGTARGISVNIESMSKILRFVPDSSVEAFSNTLSGDGKSLRIDVDQLRRKSTVSGTILCEGVGGLRAETRVDQGQVWDNDLSSQPKQVPKKLAYEDLDRLESTVYTSEKQIDTVVEKLRDLLSRERHPPQEEGNRSVLRAIWPVLLPLILGVLTFIFMLFYSRHREERRGAEAKKMGDKIGHCKEQGTLTVGMPDKEVHQILGEPNKIDTIQDKNGLLTIWYFEPPATRSYSWQPDALVKLRDGKVHSVEYKEYGKRKYGAEPEDSGGA